MLFKKMSGWSLSPIDTAVVLIDMQEYYVKNLLEEEKKLILSAQKRLLSLCTEHDIPLIVLEYENRGETIQELSEFFRKIKDVEIIKKKNDDGFRETQLNEFLKTLGVKNLILTGINASWCVRSTARSALHLGFNIFSNPNLRADDIETLTSFLDNFVSFWWYLIFCQKWNGKFKNKKRRK